MQIKVITFLYNEQFLLPYFLSHYWWADRIHFVTSPCADTTGEVVEGLCWNEKERFSCEELLFPKGLDDTLKQNKVNRLLEDSDSEWTVVVDADEFVWPRGDLACANVHVFLEDLPKTDTVVFADMWNVWRHESEKNLDASKPPVVLQRTHGETQRGGEYSKPIIIRSGRGVQLSVGNHSFAARDGHVSEKNFDGAHWQNADPCFAAKRRIQDRAMRLSPHNRANGMGHQHLNKSEADILALCEKHLHDPKLFNL